MKLEFKKRELELDIYGELVKMSFPTVSQFRVYQEKLSHCSKDTDAFSLMTELLAELGLKKELIDGMEPEHLNLVMDTISGVKKN